MSQSITLNQFSHTAILLLTDWYHTQYVQFLAYYHWTSDA